MAVDTHGPKRIHGFTVVVVSALVLAKVVVIVVAVVVVAVEVRPGEVVGWPLNVAGFVVDVVDCMAVVVGMIVAYGVAVV